MLTNLCSILFAALLPIGLNAQITIRGAHPIDSAVCGVSRAQGLQITLLEVRSLQSAGECRPCNPGSLCPMDARGRMTVEKDWGTSSGLRQRTYSTDRWALSTYFVTVFNNGRPMAKRLEDQ